MELIDKKLGETPLQTLARLRQERPAFATKKLAYAGRLDPLATGQLLVLIEDECTQRDKYQALEKIYVFQILLGISSDTGDIMGRLETTNIQEAMELVEKGEINIKGIIEKALPNFTGKVEQKFPVFSSKAVQGKPLWRYAKDGDLHKIQIPTHPIEIKQLSLETLEVKQIKDISEVAVNRIGMVEGDFRQKVICSDWQQVATSNIGERLPIATIRAHVTSGTYIRQLCLDLGEHLGTGALAWSIHREEILLQ